MSRTQPSLTLALFTLAGALALSATAPSRAHAQACGEPRVSFSWTQPPRFPIESDEAVRWPVDAGLRFAYQGDWCPSADQISLVDVNGDELPALLTLLAPEQLVQNGPPAEVVGLLKPLMSLAERTDHTLRLSPPNARLREYEDYEVSFKTNRALVGDLEAFGGVGAVEVDGDLCDGAFVDINAENFDCVTPAYLRLRISFRPLPLPEATYAVYRTRSTPRDESGAVREREVDEVERLVAVVPGVTPERAARSVSLSLPVLYAPLPREDCFRVAALDDWGRERGDGGVELCVRLTQPTEHCPPGCVPEDGNCTLIFPTAETFTYNEPISVSCSNVGVHGADPRTPVPPIMEELPPDMGPVEDMMMEPAPPSATAEEGCAQRAGRGAPLSVPLSAPLALLALLALLPRAARGARQRAKSAP